MQLGKLVGKGRTAEVYQYGEGKIVKLFLDWCRPAWVEREYRAACVVQSTGLPVPQASELVEIDGRRGIVYQYVAGPTLLGTMTSKPWTLFAAARLLAKEHALIHEKQVYGLPAQRAFLQRELAEGPNIPPEVRERSLAVLDTLPDAARLCHGDYHPDNIIMSPQGPMVIDWSNVTCGNPLADVARTLLMLGSPYLPPETPAKPIIRAMRRLFRRAYLKNYLQLTGASLDEVHRWLIPMAAARLEDRIPEEREYLLVLLSL